MSEQLNLLYTFGRAFSPLYGYVMSFRVALYKKGVLTRHHLPVPVISVGNLTLGGTGKTPMTIYLARLLAARKPAVVSRGYGGKASGRVNVVSDGKQIKLDASAAGDEPFFMAENLPGVPVITGKKRVDGGRFAVDHCGAQTVILDDGFQHLALDRNVNLALFKVDSFLGNNRIFPGGDMREPLKALGRADGFVLTCVDDVNIGKAEAIKKALMTKFPDIPVFMARYQVVSLVCPDKSSVAVEEIGPDVFAFCGLANPASFQRSLALAGIKTSGFLAFKDHCPYQRPELDLIKKQVARCGATGLVTTEKDLVKLQGKDLGLPLAALKMEMVPEEGFDKFVFDKLDGAAEVG